MTAPLRRALVGAVAVVLAAPATAMAVEPPMVLPGEAAAARVDADHTTWIVGAQPTRAASRIARAHGARHVGPAGTGGYGLRRGAPRGLAPARETRPEHGVTASHGTATASIAAAPVNGVGIAGVWPGARALNVPLPRRISCSRSADRIRTAMERDAAVISMSYGSATPCFPEYVALQFAVARGIVPVAAAGNEFAEGNRLQFPASLPHVLTVAAVGYDLRSSFFSNANSAIDLSAFGEDVMTAVPPYRDLDGVADGYERQTGTSFAAPMVAAAAAWVKAARPNLSADQVMQAVRLSATVLERRGWDRNTGFGLLSVGAALTRRPTPRDPAEPNDDMLWVDGRAFRRLDRAIYTGRRGVRLNATLDRFEDPADVYRVRLRPRSAARVSADPPPRDDVSLAAFGASARSLDARPVVRS